MEHKYTKSIKSVLPLGILLSVCLLSCQTNESQNNSTDNIGQVATGSINYGQVFKFWLRDTLPSLREWEEKDEVDIPKKEILLDEDSLVLYTNSYYAATITKNKNQDLAGKVPDVISLLKEYDELPKGDFKLNFLSSMYYSPASVEQSKYNFIYEIKDIIVEETDSKTKYDYIRGRLSNKKTIKKKKAGESDTVRVDFIWKGDRLIKKVQ